MVSVLKENVTGILEKHATVTEKLDDGASS
jgi:hypothetical protein